MRMFPASSQPAFRFLQNLLTLCGLWFLFGFIGSPLTYIFGRVLLEGVVFTGYIGHIALRLLGSLPSFLVAALLGAALPHFIVSGRKRQWALSFGLYLGFFHLLSWIDLSRTSPEDASTELFLAVLLGLSALLGFARSAHALAASPANAGPGA